jgi:DNA-directed RNA polymerase specialized sigma24 family protein
MGVTAGAVKQHLSRARQRLAAELGEPDLELEVECP